MKNEPQVIKQINLFALSIYRFIFLLILLIPQILSAQKNHKIRGIVFDRDNNPIELATVRISNTINGTVTGFDGRFVLSLQESADSIELDISCLGYKSQRRMIKLITGDITLSIRLYPTARQLNEVTVTTIRPQTSFLQSINANESRLMPNTSGSFETILTTFAGVNTNNELSSQYSVKGGNYDENIIYVNGIEIYRPLLIRAGQQEGLSFINSDMVEKVNFSSGGFDAQYGDKMSSVLDITYKKPTQNEAAASISLMGGSAYVGTASNKFTQIHGARVKTNTMLLGTLETKGEYNPWFVDYQTQMNYRFTPRWEVSFLGNYSQNNYTFKPTNRNTTFGSINNPKSFTVYFEGEEKDLFRTFVGALTINHKPTDHTDISLLISAYSTDEKETYDIAGEYWLSDASTSSENQPSSNLGIGSYHQHARNYLRATVYNGSLLGATRLKHHTIKWGITYQHELIKDRIREWEMRDSAGYSLPQLGDGVNLNYSLTSQTNLASHRVQTYIQDLFKFRSNAGLFRLHAGIRGSYWSFNNELIVSPRLSLSFIPNINQSFTFRVATGIYYQSPFYKEFRDTIQSVSGHTSIALNKEIKSQRSIHFLLGGDYQFNAFDRPFKFTTELYYKVLSDLIPYTVDNVRIRYYGRNISSGYTAGIDMKLFGQFVPGSDSWLSLSLMKSEEKINEKWIPRPSEQRYALSLFFNDYFPKFPKVKVSLKAIWADGLPFSTPKLPKENGMFRTSPYRRIDIGASYRIVGNDLSTNNRARNLFKSLWLSIEVFNLLDIKNVNSYFWISDVQNNNYAIPNYLTSRQFNIRLTADF